MINTLIKINNIRGGLNKYLGLSKGLNAVSIYIRGLETNSGTLLCNTVFCIGLVYKVLRGPGLLNKKKRVSIRCLHSRKAAYTTRVPLQKWEKLNQDPSFSTIFKDKTRH